MGSHLAKDAVEEEEEEDGDEVLGICAHLPPPCRS